MNQSEKIVQYLLDGNEASTAELSSRFGVKNVRAAVDTARSDIRKGGLDIYSNSRTNAKGVTVNKYRIGTTTNQVHFGREAVEWFTSNTYKSMARSGLV